MSCAITLMILGMLMILVGAMFVIASEPKTPYDFAGHPSEYSLHLLECQMLRNISLWTMSMGSLLGLLGFFLIR